MARIRSRKTSIKKRNPALQDYLRTVTPQGEQENDYSSDFELFHLSDIERSRDYLLKKIRTQFKGEFKLLDGKMTVTISFNVSGKTHEISRTYNSFIVHNGDARQILDILSKKAIDRINSVYEKGLVRFDNTPGTDKTKEKERIPKPPEGKKKVRQCLTCGLAIFEKTKTGRNKIRGECSSESHDANVFFTYPSVDEYFKMDASNRIDSNCPCWESKEI
jgi:hypothetical protein